MITFIKAQAASILGSLADFLLTIVLVEAFRLGYVLANVAGNIAGACILFLCCRYWAFHAEAGNISNQVLKFTLVWAGSIALSAAGVYFFATICGVYYLAAKLIVSISLGLSYNYILQKRFVFAGGAVRQPQASKGRASGSV